VNGDILGRENAATSKLETIHARGGKGGSKAIQVQCHLITLSKTRSEQIEAFLKKVLALGKEDDKREGEKRQAEEAKREQAAKKAASMATNQGDLSFARGVKEKGDLKIDFTKEPGCSGTANIADREARSPG
jgi:hypothetical protein